MEVNIRDVICVQRCPLPPLPPPPPPVTNNDIKLSKQTSQPNPLTGL